MNLPYTNYIGEHHSFCSGKTVEAAAGGESISDEYAEDISSEK